MGDAYVLRLFVAGRSDRSARSVDAARRLCEEHLPDGCRLEVVDVLEDPAAAEAAKVVATPTLLRMAPAPQRSVIGDLDDLDRVADLLRVDRPPAAAAVAGDV